VNTDNVVHVTDGDTARQLPVLSALFISTISAGERILNNLLLLLLLLLLLELSGVFTSVEQRCRVSGRPAVLTTRHHVLCVCRLHLRDVIAVCALTQTADVTQSHRLMTSNRVG